jgi:hypothetical protein
MRSHDFSITRNYPCDCAASPMIRFLASSRAPLSFSSEKKKPHPRGSARVPNLAVPNPDAAIISTRAGTSAPPLRHCRAAGVEIGRRGEGTRVGGWRPPAAAAPVAPASIRFQVSTMDRPRPSCCCRIWRRQMWRSSRRMGSWSSSSTETCRVLTMDFTGTLNNQMRGFYRRYTPITVHDW